MTLHRQPFVHGYADQLTGKCFLDNPYLQDSNDFRVWIDGYVKSMQDHREPYMLSAKQCHVCRRVFETATELGEHYKEQHA